MKKEKEIILPEHPHLLARTLLSPRKFRILSFDSEGFWIVELGENKEPFKIKVESDAEHFPLNYLHNEFLFKKLDRIRMKRKKYTQQFNKEKEELTKSLVSLKEVHEFLTKKYFIDE